MLEELGETELRGGHPDVRLVEREEELSWFTALRSFGTEGGVAAATLLYAALAADRGQLVFDGLLLQAQGLAGVVAAVEEGDHLGQCRPHRGRDVEGLHPPVGRHSHELEDRDASVAAWSTVVACGSRRLFPEAPGGSSKTYFSAGIVRS